MVDDEIEAVGQDIVCDGQYIIIWRINPSIQSRCLGS